MDDALKPCPCCGERPRWVSFEPGRDLVECPACGLASDCGQRERVRAKWNTRAPLPVPKEVWEMYQWEVSKYRDVWKRPVTRNNANRRRRWMDYYARGMRCIVETIRITHGPEAAQSLEHSPTPEQYDGT